MGKHLVLVGGGHAHLTTLLKLKTLVDRGHRVTLMSPSPFHYYSGMGPGLLAGTFAPAETRFHIRRMAETRGATFIQDQVRELAPGQRRLILASGAELDYDLASFNIGSAISLEPGLDASRVIAVKPIENLYQARQDILARRRENPRLVVLGGGAAGVEIAGNLWRLLNTHQADGHITLVAGGGLLPALPRRAQELARRSLEQRGIEIIEGDAATACSATEVCLAGGRCLPCDLILAATGVRPPALFGRAGLEVGEEGGLAVNECLQSTSDPCIFGGGDCIHFSAAPLARVGVHAVRQNPVLWRNLRAALEGRELLEYRPQKKFLLILNLGDGTGIAVRGPFTGNGTGALHLKTWIDRRFMRRFQVSDEVREAAQTL
ncbi:FAD-dependent oxidoreductase [Geoalkalibacter halelectricus]|uniref:FAD-dependent oxidoreductase n=1 Tax=Geoalkalibacter halelectricus TaxID=2847045 RepID=A0ABY5ZN64_9BACT|nr:FAD-dependent oxidoreductase [Geoalkalibacter halelectricus]MDO3378609.1 FAD-dependent oxidoreductase [Geoalkalibacter halelectricus]UWZ80078.1 FAD-dependent oxidoreductase [Geoalkalibacter halelectricus]